MDRQIFQLQQDLTKYQIIILLIPIMFFDIFIVNSSQTLKQLAPYQIVIYEDIEIISGCYKNIFQYAKLPE